MTRRSLLATAPAVLTQSMRAQNRKRNVVFILTDDQRFDALGALGHPFLKGHTPHQDRLLRDGVHFRNAFVTSSLCSPSRASILTGLYMHAHKVFDNFSPLSQSHETFPRLLQQSGYQTAFLGKWHMGGDSDAPQPGFHRWLSFRGQGEYANPEINDDGRRRRASGYMTDLLTDESNRFIRDNASRPFCLYLSHKAIHAPFQPHPKHADLFAGMDVPKPASMTYRQEYYEHLPEWVKRRRYSRHGVDGMLGHSMSFDDAYRNYCRSLLAVDDSVGAVLHQLEESRLLNDTLVIYMGDNGYMWGEHGLIDKRAMYEESIRVPLVAHCPDLTGPRVAEGMALNIDIGPTLLDAAGVKPPAAMHGRSLLPLMQGKPVEWRNDFVYEYEWEQDYPYTPTITGLRTAQHSFMQYQGVWDISELYDMKGDPQQMNNILRDVRIYYQRGRISMNVPKDRKPLVDQLQARLHEILTETGGDPRRSGKGSEGDQYAL
jgi:N-acetylglucosamine-6-sulfatase